MTAPCTRPTAEVAGVTLTLPPDHDIVEIKGMSMAPYLRDGMLAVVDRSQRIPSPPGTHMVDLGLGEQPMLVESRAIGTKCIVRLWLADASYGSLEMSPDDVPLRGRIVCVFTPV